MLLTAPDVIAHKGELIAKEIQEMRDALIRLGKRIWRLTLQESASLSVGGNGLATSINERRASAKTSGLLGTRIS